MQVNYRHDGVLATVEGSPDAIEKHFQELQRDGIRVTNRQNASGGVNGLSLNGQQTVKVSKYAPSTADRPTVNHGTYKPATAPPRPSSYRPTQNQSAATTVNGSSNRVEYVDGVRKPMTAPSRPKTGPASR